MVLELRKGLKLLDLFAIAFGSIIGWGVFTLVGDWFETSGSWGTAIAAFIGALMVLPIALSYSILIPRSPKAGGEFTWAWNSLGKHNGFFCGWWLYTSYFSIMLLNATAFPVWVQIIVPQIVKWGYMYTVSKYDVYAGYVTFSFIILTFFFLLNYIGVRAAGFTQRLMVLLLIASGYFYIIAGFVSGGISNTMSPSPWSLKNGMYGILTWLAIAPWAYVGFDTVPQAMEETHIDPEKARIAILLSLFIGASFYALIPLATAAIMPWDNYIGEWLATATAAEYVLGDLGKTIVFLGALMGILTGINGFMLASSRLLFAMAREGSAPKIFSHIHSTYSTPNKALVFTYLLALPLIFLGRDLLIWFVNVASFGTAVAYSYTGFSLVKSRGSKREHVLGLISGVMGIIFGLLLILQLQIESIIAIITFSVIGMLMYHVGSRQ